MFHKVHERLTQRITNRTSERTMYEDVNVEFYMLLFYGLLFVVFLFFTYTIVYIRQKRRDMARKSSEQNEIEE